MTIDFQKLETILQNVERPGRYIGHEFNWVIKKAEKTPVRVVLVFPDVYELGMSYEGFKILYHILNQLPFVWAERTFTPWPDFEANLRKWEIPLFSLESKTALCSFDILGFTLQYELHATNILNTLQLGGVSIHREDRDEGDPLVVAGGPCAFNPEPLSDFVDVFVIGDGEDVVREMVTVYRDAKKEGAPRKEILRRWAKIEGVYVPGFYKDFYDEGGHFQALKPISPDIPRKIRARILPELREENYPSRPLVPLVRTTHDRLSVEVMRGCTRGCRFCNAGYIYRPTRERSYQNLVTYIENTLDATGYEEVSLVSLSTSDYSQLGELWFALKKTLEKRHVSLSLPSLRPETITPELLRSLKAEKKSGLTIAPEAGTDRLRRVINKFMRDEDILRAVETAFGEGWRMVKLYFMIGLPTETEEDLLGIASLTRKILEVGRKFGSVGVRISISPFSPKPHTPFQWMAQDSIETFQQKIRFLRSKLSRKNVEVSYRDPRVSFLEEILSRGDRRLGRVIEQAWRNGAKFDAWTDQFKWHAWQQAFEQTGTNPDEYTRQRSLDEPLPWDHISRGLTKKYLKEEYRRAFLGAITPDCKYTLCNLCGLMKLPSCQEVVQRGTREKAAAPEEILIERALHPIYHWQDKIPAEKTSTLERKKEESTVAKKPTWFRLQYRKVGWIRFLGHLDLQNVFQRAFRRLKLPLAFSQGFSPHPKISPGPPLPLGYESEAEFLDIQLTGEDFPNLAEKLNAVLPEGILVVRTRKMGEKTRPISAIAEGATYEVVFFKWPAWLEQKTADFLGEPEVWIERIQKGKRKRFNLRAFVEALEADAGRKSLLIDIRFQNGKAVRVKEVLAAIAGGVAEALSPFRVTRKALWLEREGKRLSPMDV